jgi:hypothetical protein
MIGEKEVEGKERRQKKKKRTQISFLKKESIGV